jgi:very-short-patch-repair endonuclease
MDRLNQLGGAATSAQLRNAGASESQLSAAVRTGTLVRVRKGLYRSPDAAESIRESLEAGGRLSCVTAARSYGLWGGCDSRLHIHVPPHATRLPESRAVRHWVHSEQHPEVWRVSIDDCLRSVARCADEETAVAVFDTAISARAVTASGLRAVLAGEARRVRALGALARPGSESGVESIVRQRLEARGHIVEQQVHVPRVGRVDMRVDGEVFVEIDGFAFHGDRRSFERDRERDTGLAVRGAPRLRVSAAQVLGEWPRVENAIERVLTIAATEERRISPAVTGIAGDRAAKLADL